MPQDSHINKIIALVIVVIGVLVALYFYYNGWQKSKTPELPTQAEMRTSLLNGSTINFASSAESKNIATSILPADLKFLVPTEALGTIVEEQDNSSGEKSYRIIFTVDYNMHVYFLEIRSNLLDEKWAQLSSKRSDLIDVIEFTNSLYELRAETTFVTSAEVTSENVEQISAQSQRSRVVIQVKQK